MGDLNPDFAFDFGGKENTIQAPWEFADAMADAAAAHGTTGTSLDHKIQKHLAAKRKAVDQSGQVAKSRKQAPPQQPRKPQPGSDLNDLGSEDELNSDDEDKPLPGELDDDDSDADSEDAVAFNDEDDDDDNMEADDSENEDQDASNASDASENDEPVQAEGIASQSDKEVEDSDAEAEQATDRRRSGQAAGPSGKDRKAFFAATPNGTMFSARSFGDLNLSRPLVKACTALGYAQPTPIQAACIPLALNGRDICGSAVTGSGKTAAFALPFLERLLFRSRRLAATYVLVLTPTRELAVQVHSMTQKLAQFTDIRVALAVGGLSLNVQASTLRTNPEVVVATPGRIIDHLRNTQSFGLEELQMLVLDEADRLLEMGFAEEIKEIVRMAPRKRQTMLFSATLNDEVRKLIAVSLNKPVRLAADVMGRAPEELTQEIIRLKGNRAIDKEAVLLALCSRSFQGGRTIVFFRTKQRAHRAKMLFGLGGLAAAGELHGNMTQAARLESLERFRKGELAFLLATDVAARGLDILGVETVVNFDAPAALDSYLHRIGRTARAGKQGRAVTLVEDTDRGLLKEVVKKTGARLQTRLVPQPAITEWRGRVERMAGDLERLVQEEGEETALRKAEMELQKAQNMVEHEAEIFARPPRTWFQTEKQKRETAEAAKRGEAGAAAEEAKKTKKDKESRKAERKLEKAREKAKNEDHRKRKNVLMEETGALGKNIRAVKAKEAQLRMEGMPAAQAGKAAAAAVLGIKSASKDKKKKAKKDTLFEGDGTGRPVPDVKAPSKVYAGGGLSGKVKVPKSGTLSKAELNRVKRGGKGHKAFKSKARHKRR
ncbi:hypothetical protein WJX72_000533 [[Myrmecia] bisecta]|uniref:RNA helicase n=1 Tax=[Myrmecia] bisecta TaxID=41462 RepID=A0AAW1R451_9CHLO